MGEHVEHLYVHVPFCATKCSYCAFSSSVYMEQAAADYVAALREEYRLRCNSTFSFRTIYVGGGTPSVLSTPLLEHLLATITPSHEPEEWTVELNPGSISCEKLTMLRHAGVGRVSVGGQSFNDAELAAMGRPYDRAGLISALSAVRKAGFRAFGLDLIAAYPGRTRSDWAAMLETAVRLGPDHLSVYCLSFEDGTGLSAARSAGRVQAVSADEELEHLEFAREFLQREGLQRYEISNYARPGHECRHNMAVWRGEDYMGLGPSACARLGLLRRSVHPAIGGYCAALLAGETPPCSEETLSSQADAEERLLFQLRTREGLIWPKAANANEVSDGAGRSRQRILRLWQPLLEDFIARGLACRTAAGVRLSARGMNVADALMEALLSSG